MGSIYERQQKLTVSQLVTVAERRLDDAQALCDTDRNRHANGAQYLGGFVIELLLKAQLIQRFNLASSRDVASRSPGDLRVWSLVYRSHNLSEMLDRMPELEALIVKRGQRDGRQYRNELRSICSTWTIFARYSTRTSTIAEAKNWLDRIRDLKEILK